MLIAVPSASLARYSPRVHGGEKLEFGGERRARVVVLRHDLRLLPPPVSLSGWCVTELYRQQGAHAQAPRT